MNEEVLEDINSLEGENKEATDQEKIAQLIVDNQMLRHKAVVLAELALGASKVLDYYASSRLALPTFTLVDYSNDESPLHSKAKYKIVEVLDTPGPDKEIMVGKEMYDLRIDVQTAERASKQILEKFNELGIVINYETPEEQEVIEQDEQNEQGDQLHLDLEGSEE